MYNYSLLYWSSLCIKLFNKYFVEVISQEWLMMGSPIPIVTVVSLYLLVVLKLGPDYMKDREPYKLKNLMRIYNIAQVLYNAAILYLVRTVSCWKV